LKLVISAQIIFKAVFFIAIFEKKADYMQKFIVLIVFFTTYYSVRAQTIVIDSGCKDSLGMFQELNEIAHKLGNFPDTVYQNLRCVEVYYYGFKANEIDSLTLRKGALIIDKSVEEDVKSIFEELKIMKFPIATVIPVNTFGLNRDSSGWNDLASMEANNSSAFNYRLMTNSKELSPHAFGKAIDLNPLFNPYEKYVHDGKITEPDNAFYDLNRAGTVSDGRIVGIFDKRGWIWGGRWNNPVDYQHFDLRKDRARKHYLMKDSRVKDIFSYGENDKSLSLYATHRDKKMDNPELFLSEEDLPVFNTIIKKYPLSEILQLWKSENKIKAEPEILLKNKEIKALRIAIFVETDSLLLPWNRYLAERLEKLLTENGAVVTFSTEEYSRQDLVIGIGLGNRNMYNMEISNSIDYQVIYVPGAYKLSGLVELEDRLCFLNLLCANDLTESIDLATKIQSNIQEKTGLEPVSRQLTGPNLLETEGIKTDYDGIYCRNIQKINRYACPSVFISAFSIGNLVEFENWIQPKNGFQQCEKLADAILLGLLSYLEK
jgi:peptidoglycan LD-endopeptidase CwlK